MSGSVIQSNVPKTMYVKCSVIVKEELDQDSRIKTTDLNGNGKSVIDEAFGH